METSNGRAHLVDPPQLPVDDAVLGPPDEENIAKLEAFFGQVVDKRCKMGRALLRLRLQDIREILSCTKTDSAN